MLRAPWPLLLQLLMALLLRPPAVLLLLLLPLLLLVLVGATRSAARAHPRGGSGTAEGVKGRRTALAWPRWMGPHPGLLGWGWAGGGPDICRASQVQQSRAAYRVGSATGEVKQ